MKTVLIAILLMSIACAHPEQTDVDYPVYGYAFAMPMHKDPGATQAPTEEQAERALLGLERVLPGVLDLIHAYRTVWVSGSHYDDGGAYAGLIVRDTRNRGRGVIYVGHADQGFRCFTDTAWFHELLHGWLDMREGTQDPTHQHWLWYEVDGWGKGMRWLCEEE